MRRRRRIRNERLTERISNIQSVVLRPFGIELRIGWSGKAPSVQISHFVFVTQHLYWWCHQHQKSQHHLRSPHTHSLSLSLSQFATEHYSYRSCRLSECPSIRVASVGGRSGRREYQTCHVKILLSRGFSRATHFHLPLLRVCWHYFCSVFACRSNLTEVLWPVVFSDLQYTWERLHSVLILGLWGLRQHALSLSSTRILFLATYFIQCSNSKSECTAEMKANDKRKQIPSNTNSQVDVFSSFHIDFGYMAFKEWNTAESNSTSLPSNTGAFSSRFSCYFNTTVFQIGKWKLELKLNGYILLYNIFQFHWCHFLATNYYKARLKNWQYTPETQFFVKRN